MNEARRARALPNGARALALLKSLCESGREMER